MSRACMYLVLISLRGTSCLTLTATTFYIFFGFDFFLVVAAVELDLDFGS